MPLKTGAQEPLVLAIHPYLPVNELIDRYTPLANYLGEYLGRTITIRVGRNYREHIECIGRDKADIAFMGPSLYIKMVDMYGEKPLLARLEINDKHVFHGKIITRKDSPLNSLEDLKGKRFAFGDMASTMSHLVPRHTLWTAGITDDDLADYRFVGNHTNVALGVLMGDFHAGAVKEEVFYKFEREGLKAIATTPPLLGTCIHRPQHSARDHCGESAECTVPAQRHDRGPRDHA